MTDDTFQNMGYYNFTVKCALQVLLTAFNKASRQPKQMDNVLIFAVSVARDFNATSRRKMANYTHPTQLVLYTRCLLADQTRSNLRYYLVILDCV